jgi:hypothetical protein
LGSSEAIWKVAQECATRCLWGKAAGLINCGKAMRDHIAPVGAVKAMLADQFITVDGVCAESC